MSEICHLHTIDELIISKFYTENMSYDFILVIYIHIEGPSILAHSACSINCFNEKEMKV